MSLTSEIFKGLLGPVGDFFKRRAELKQARFEARLNHEKALADRQAQLIREGLAADANWEMEFARQAATSWKDEYTLFVVSIPMVMGFIPDTVGYVESGFVAFGQAPLWYQMMVQVMFYATVGVRFWRRNQSDT